MQDMRGWIGAGAMLALALSLLVPVEAASAPESKRMSRAKDLIADEQWLRAIEELRAAAADPKEPARDEALFWLAHSHNQAGDRVGAVETILRLEESFPTSRWTKPAGSLRIEIAQRLHRNDILWEAALPPLPPTPPPSETPRAASRPPVRQPQPSRPPAVMPAPPAETPAALPSPAPPPDAWFSRGPWTSDEIVFDTDLRIQALGSLIKTDAAKVIPILKEIALEDENLVAARRAVFVLAASGREDARSTVVEVAKKASEPVRIAAVRELGRFGGPEASRELLQVYSFGNGRVKYQVVLALGDRAETLALMRIAESEADGRLRERAILTLGRAGGRQELRKLYTKLPRASKRAIIDGLFNARAEAELWRIAEEEKDEALRREAQRRLRLLGTQPPARRAPKAPENR